MSDFIKTVYAAYTNSDCTEGRGHDVVIAVCELRETAVRLAARQYVQGSDGPVHAIQLIEVDGKWYSPLAVVNVIKPTNADIKAHNLYEAEQQLVAAKEAALGRAKAAGMSEDDISTLRA